MSEIRILIKLVKAVKTPKQAAILFAGSAVLIGIVYLIPKDLLEDL